MFKPNKEIWMIFAALAVLVACFAPASFAGERLTADLNEPFEFDGTVYGPGEIKVYELAEYSPGAALTELRVDDVSVGLVLARESSGDAVTVRDELIFSRDVEGHLVLTGIAYAGRAEVELLPLEDRTPGADALMIASND